jgi:hypothetical protein
MKRRRRRLRWLRAKAWRIVRSQYLVSFPLVALIVAGAGALGAFDAQPRPEVRAERVSFIPTPIVFSTPAGYIPTDSLIVTYILVSSEDMRMMWDRLENDLIWREVLQYGTFEVEVVTNQQEETEAFSRIATARADGKKSGFEVVIQDMRTKP